MTTDNSIEKKSGRKTGSRNHDGWLEKLPSGIYLARIRINGRPKSKSTGTKDEKEARRFLKAWSEPFRIQDKIRSKKLLQIEIDETKQELEDLLSKKNTVKVEDGFDAYLTLPNVSKLSFKTIYEYRLIYNHFIKWLKTNHPVVVFMGDLNKPIAEAFLSYIKQEKSPSRYNRYLKVLKLVWGKFDVVKPFENCNFQPEPKSKREPLTPEEVKKILSYMKEKNIYDGELHDCYSLQCSLGYRGSDAAHLRWDEIDFKNHYIYKAAQIKTGKPVGNYLIPSLEKMLLERSKNKQDETYVFPTVFYKHSTRVLSNDLNKIFKACGITTSEKTPWGYRSIKSGHSARHFFISWLLSQNVGAEQIAAFAGHTKYAQSQEYAHPTPELYNSIIPKLPNVFAEPKDAKFGQPDISPEMMSLIQKQCQNGESIEECLKRLLGAVVA